jgi:hypothetical protein
MPEETEIIKENKENKKEEAIETNNTDEVEKSVFEKKGDPRFGSGTHFSGNHLTFKR